MQIILSFDTEDFTDPAANDVLLRICRLLTRHGVRGSFGLVGEKARFLRDTGRPDVIEALAEHCICYHTDNHFLFPDASHQPRFASEVIEDCDWDEAVRWLVATEARGLVDIEELFGRRPITYLRTCGDSAPQILEAYRQLGLKVFAYGPSLYERTRHLAWYANQLCVSLPLLSEEITYTGGGPAELDRLAAAGEDPINIRFHPCRFLSDEWWDVVNFLNVPDPPTAPPYQLAPHLPAGETERRLARLGALIDHAREQHQATFTTYDALAEAQPRPPAFLTPLQVAELARAVQTRLAPVMLDGLPLSLAETFAAVTWAVLHPRAEQVPLRHPVGPVRRPDSEPAPEGEALPAPEVLSACQEAELALASRGRVPDQVRLAGRPAPPAALLRAAAGLLRGRAPLRLEASPLYPEGFDEMLRRWDAVDFDLVAFFPNRGRPAPNTKEAIKLQYWTYKIGARG